MYSTYNGWKLQGRQVVMGERGAFRNEYGDMMFHKSQTKFIHPEYEMIRVRRDRYGRFISQN